MGVQSLATEPRSWKLRPRLPQKGVNHNLNLHDFVQKTELRDMDKDTSGRGNDRNKQLVENTKVHPKGLSFRLKESCPLTYPKQWSQHALPLVFFKCTFYLYVVSTEGKSEGWSAENPNLHESHLNGKCLKRKFWNQKGTDCI